MAGAALAHGRAPAAVLARDCTSALNDIAACLALGCAYCCDSNLCVDGVPPDCTTVATSTSGPGGCGGTSGPTGTPSPAASRWVAAFLLSLVVLPMVALILAVVGVSATRAWRRYLERKRLHPQPPLPGTAAAALPAPAAGHLAAHHHPTRDALEQAVEGEIVALGHVALAGRGRGQRAIWVEGACDHGVDGGPGLTPQASDADDQRIDGHRPRAGPGRRRCPPRPRSPRAGSGPPGRRGRAGASLARQRLS